MNESQWSLAKQLAHASTEEQQAFIDGLTDEQLHSVQIGEWWFIGRPAQQLPQGSWSQWLIQTGRDWGKTRTGAENFYLLIRDNPVDVDGSPTHWAVIAETFSDAREVCLEGPSGLLSVLKRHGLVEDRDYTWNKSLYVLTFATGQVVHLFGAGDRDTARGYNLAGVWCDEVAKWPYGLASWKEGIRLALRAMLPSGSPRAIITSTPKPANPLMVYLAGLPTTIATTGSIDENADNIPPETLAEFHDLYDNTRIGEQELHGKMITDVEGALWQYNNILHLENAPELKRIIVAVDPSVSDTENSDECGIVCVGRGVDDRGYVLADYTIKASVNEWAQRAVACYEEFNADLVVYEENQGGDAIREVLKQVAPYLPTEPVRAYIGKRLRAEPIANLYQQGRISHVGHFDKLEGQMTTWNPYEKGAKSPDRVDALVHAATKLFPTRGGSNILAAMADICPSCRQFNTKGVSVCAYCSATMS